MTFSRSRMARALLRQLGVDRRDALCGVPVAYASASSPGRLDLTQNRSVLLDDRQFEDFEVTHRRVPGGY